MATCTQWSPQSQKKSREFGSEDGHLDHGGGKVHGIAALAAIIIMMPAVHSNVTSTYLVPLSQLLPRLHLHFRHPKAYLTPYVGR